MKRILIVTLIFIIPFCCFGKLKPAGIFGNNAVIQQRALIPVWGLAYANSEIEVNFAGIKIKTIADEKGDWMVNFPPMKVDGIHHKMTFKSGKDKITYQNILIGDVWFASGQSNMAFTMNDGIMDAEKEISNANYPNIRFRTVEAIAKSKPADDIPQKDWAVCNPENVKSFSAVSYFFARELMFDKNIPVGVIVSAIGATGIGCWMSRESMLSYPPLKEETASFNPDTTLWNARVRRCDSLSNESGRILTSSNVGLNLGVNRLEYDASNWNKTKYPMDIPKMGYPGYWGLVWMRKPFEITPKMAKKKWTLHIPMIVSDYRAYFNGKEIKRGNTSLTELQETLIEIPSSEIRQGENLLSFRMWVVWSLCILGDKNMPCNLMADDGTKIDLTDYWWHNSTVEPEVYRLQDFYWFQSTANYNGMVSPVIPYAISGYLWYQGEANAQWGKAYSEMQPMLISDWRTRWKLGYIPFLYVQLASFGERSETPKSEDYMAEFRDYQTHIMNLSPNTYMASTIDIGEEKNIHPRNKQDVGKRLYAIYKANVLHEKVVGSGPIFKTAKADGNKVRISYYDTPNGLMTKDKSPIKGFALTDTTGKWVWANALIDGCEVVVWADGVNKPTIVQYAWQSNPEAPLYNKEGFPALPFKKEIMNNK